MTREEIINTATRIAEIRQELARLQPLQKELKQLEAKLDSLSDSPPESTGDPDSLVEKAIRVVCSDPVRDWSAEDVNELIKGKLPSIRAALSKASGSLGRIAKRGRGKFGTLAAQRSLEVVPTEEHIGVA
jgi:hypothetical protein